MSQMEKERTNLRNKLSEKEKGLSDLKKKENKNHNVPKKLRIGDTVKVLSMNVKGTVHSLPNAKGDLYVQMGILRSIVNINDLILIDLFKDSYLQIKSRFEVWEIRTSSPVFEGILLSP